MTDLGIPKLARQWFANHGCEPVCVNDLATELGVKREELAGLVQEHAGRALYPADSKIVFIHSYPDGTLRLRPFRPRADLPEVIR